MGVLKKSCRRPMPEGRSPKASGIVTLKKPGNRIHMCEVETPFFPMVSALTEGLSLAQAITYIDQACDPTSLRDFVASLTPCLISR